MTKKYFNSKEEIQNLKKLNKIHKKIVTINDKLQNKPFNTGKQQEEIRKLFVKRKKLEDEYISLSKFV